MIEFIVGNVIQEFKGKPEGTLFQMDGTGMSLVVGFDSPTEYEVSQFKEKSRFEFRFTELNHTIFTLFKIGELNWMDAAFLPQTSTCDFEQVIEDGTGYLLTLMLVDVRTGVLMSQRAIGLGTKFSRDFQKTALGLKKEPFDKEKTEKDALRVFASYSTKQLIKNAKNYYKI